MSEKPLQDFLNDVSQEKGYPNYEEFSMWIIEHNYPQNIATLIEGTYRVAAEHYATYRAEQAKAEGYDEGFKKREDDSIGTISALFGVRNALILKKELPALVNPYKTDNNENHG